MALTMGRWLAIEATSEACSVALFDHGALVAGDYALLGRGHAEALVPMIARLPGKGRADAIAVGLGPGSFTGVRIGIAAARALAFAWGVEVRGYPTLALIAAMARAARGDAATVLVAINGGHGQWFVQHFDGAGMAGSPLAALSPEAAAALPDRLVAGTRAEALVARRGYGTALAITPDARKLALLPEDAFTPSLAPLYGRAPDATLARPAP